LMPREVTITVDDREDSTTIKLPDNYFGRVELVFKGGKLLHIRREQTEVKSDLKTQRLG